MAFPEKPDFFDLNELECRLLAPRITLQKLMQAPRGRQLKIHGNFNNVPADVTSTVRHYVTRPAISDWHNQSQFKEKVTIQEVCNVIECKTL